MHPTRLPAYQRQLPRAADWDDVSESLSSAGVFPEQFFALQSRSCTEHPEVALMRAVLADALVCFQRGFARKGRRVQRLAQEAEAWFLKDDDRWPFSFVSICAVLGLEPSYIRRGLRRWSQGSSETMQRVPRRPEVVQRRLAA
jgi:hypothetical protein